MALTKPKKTLESILLIALLLFCAWMFSEFRKEEAHWVNIMGLTIAVISTAALLILKINRWMLRDALASKEIALEALSDSNNRYRILVQSIERLAIISLDMEGSIVDWNVGAESILGYSIEEVKGRNIKSLYQNEFQSDSDLQLFLDQARVLGQTKETVWRRRKDGSRFWASSMIHLMKNDQGQPIGYVKILEDKTQEKLFEDSLVESEERLRSVVNTVMDGIITINDHGIIISANFACERIFGHKIESLIGRNVNVLMPDPYRKNHDGYILNFLTSNQKKVIGVGREVEGLKVDGSVFPMDLQVAEFRLKGKRFFTGIVRDISARKKLEDGQHALHLEMRATLEKEVSERTNALEAANLSLNATITELVDSRRELRRLSKRLNEVLEQERSKIARNVHDELGQLLAVIKIGLGRLKKASAPFPNSEELFSNLAQTVDQTILKMRAFSSELKPVILEQLGLLPAIEWLTQNLAKQTGITCKLKSSGNFDGLSSELTTGLYRVLQEALTNALKHSGSLKIDVRLTTDSEEVTLEVEDYGVGMPQKGHKNSQTLGLISMRERVIGLGGSIQIGNRTNGGTMVNVKVPRETPDL